MAVGTYTTDLVVIASCEDKDADPGLWAEMTGHSGGGADATETDYFIQGDACISQSTGAADLLEAGLMYNFGSDISGSIEPGMCVFFWQVFLAANAVDSWANGGLRVMIGSSTGNFKFWRSGGKDFGRYPYGGWQNVVVDPLLTPDYEDGSPTSAAQYFGSLPNIVSPVSKGNPHACDVLRYGRGKIIIENGQTGAYGTFTNMASVNDSQYNRWGLFQEIAGGYLWKGLMSIGSVATSVNFQDANANIVVDDTRRTYKSFNRIEINNANSIVSWSAVQITALGSASPGELEVVGDCAFTLDSCTFTDMGSSVFKSNSTITDSTFRRCAEIYQHSATFNGCTFDSSTASQFMVSANNITAIQNCAFTAPTNAIHAMRIDTTGTYTLTGCTYSGFGASGTSAATIYNNSGGLVTLNLAGGDSPTIRNGTGASTDVVVAVVLTLTGLPASTEVTVVASGAARTVLHNTENASGSDQYSYGAAQVGTVVDILCHNIDYDPSFGSIYNYTLGATSTSIPIQMVPDPNYYNP